MGVKMKKAQKENHIVRVANLDIITECLWRNNGRIDLDGYENDSQRVHFTNCGHKCVLYGVVKTQWEEGTMTLLVRTTHEGVDDIFEVTLGIDGFRIDTLKRIAYEVYDYIKDAEDEDFDFVYKDVVGGWLDTLYKKL